ncbi:iron ABC transporter substrate-binding protein [Prolixibacteraceae bacterium JC049]|nr:iron ABC transporter substrate-binding protein [Prolixibacteraceae bacterium JC049]
MSGRRQTLNRYIGALVCLFVFFACAKSTKNKSVSESNKSIPVEKKLEYAQEFKIEKKGNVTRLSIHRKGEENAFDTFQLVKGGIKNDGTGKTIKVPCKKIVCLSSTQLCYFFALDDVDDIIAINSSRYLQHKKMKERLSNGQTKRIGKEGQFNLEMVAALNPDVIFVSPFKAGGYDVLRNLGIPLVPMAAYNEQTPLGRAEWIKMMALFVGKEQQADSIFHGIEKRYNYLKELTSKVEKRPTVFSGKMRSGSWYVPGGNSFYAHYFRDAGADYIINDNKQGAYPVDFETIYSKASHCDYWRIIHPEKSGLTLAELGEQDPRYTDFDAFQKKNVLLCNIREKAYYEQAGIKPDVLLADYIHYFHPDLLPNHTPYFYERLK